MHSILEKRKTITHLRILILIFPPIKILLELYYRSEAIKKSKAAPPLLGIDLPYLFKLIALFIGEKDFISTFTGNLSI